MIKVEHINVFNFEAAIRGMRNPYNSWAKSDSDIIPWDESSSEIGENDLDLMRRLFKAGTEHRKYLRQIIVSMDITAPLYWWKEFDTYKVGTTANSCSTMHTIHKKEFTEDDFSCEHLSQENKNWWFNQTLNALNKERQKYLTTASKDTWWQLIQMLPSSYNQKRTVTMNYENVVSMIKQRTGHRLDEWNEFVKILKNLPYINAIIADKE